MEKFTPGPWKNKSEKGHYFGGAAAINTDDDKRSIAFVYGLSHEKDANARLIAAAPEMYAAMKEFCERVEKGEVRSQKTYAKFKDILARINAENKQGL